MGKRRTEKNGFTVQNQPKAHKLFPLLQSAIDKFETDIRSCFSPYDVVGCFALTKLFTHMDRMLVRVNQCHFPLATALMCFPIYVYANAGAILTTIECVHRCKAKLAWRAVTQAWQGNSVDTTGDGALG
jgi:hypothetical protein